MLLSLLSRRSLEVDSRDAYGFALRPQHLQRYREYANIYKEEEDERSEKWKNFLEQQADTAQNCWSQRLHKESLPSGVSEHRDGTVSDRPAEGDDPSDNKPSDSRIGSSPEREVHSTENLRSREHKDRTVSDRPAEGDDPSDNKPSDSPIGSSLEREVHSTENLRSSEHRDGTVSDRPAEGDDPSDNKPSDSSIGSSPEREVHSTENLRSSEHRDGTVSDRPAEGDDPSDNNKPSDSSIGSSPEREVHSTEKLKSDKVPRWANIRPVLGAIENMMSFRIEKAKNVEDDLKGVNGAHLPTVDEVSHLGQNSEDDSEGDVEIDEASNGSTHSCKGERAASEGTPLESSFPWREELECLVRGGVPKDLRGEVWQAFVGVRTRRIERYYQDLLAREASDDEGKALDNSCDVQQKLKKQIEKDIPRTFPGHPALDENGRNSLRRLLIAYARHNPSVGYCQAMNFFAGLLLLLMPEENAFWALVGIIDDYFGGYYTEEMIESQVDQLVFEELMRERFPKLVNHLDFLGVQVAWISGPWFLSIFVNMLPWESVLRIWDVLLFEGNRVMLFRTALALMELYGPAIVTTKDAGDAITLLQSLAGSTFDSSQLVLTACMGFLAITEARLHNLREKHRPSVLEVVEERSRKGRVWKDSKGLATKLYSFKHDTPSLVKETKSIERPEDVAADADASHLDNSSHLEDLLGGLAVDSEVDSLPDLQEQVVWLKVELCRLLEEKRSAILRAEELETALMEMVQQDNRLQLSARMEQLEQEVTELRQALADKKEQETAMLQVLMRVEQEQRVTEDARICAEQEVAAQKYAVHVLQEKYEIAMISLAQMEKRVVMAESMLEATLQYESGQNKAQQSPGSARSQSSAQETPARRIGLFGLGWRDRNKGKPSVEESCESPQKEITNRELEQQPK
ncbi:TBC1 domain family member 8B isoform X4 [Rhodamnia argentea]|uniref:TBC1 domain family member 8B isoform X4 n=1 Tax=Rhodamnia argentea TaxID=178133 RepID=A0A8B8NIS9_9MYRT|nr:TBC1 domain family member 8B isoform X4 [Rhodamnia argentea]